MAHLRFLAILASLSLTAALLRAAETVADTHPRIPGYERVYRSSSADTIANTIAAGQLLLGELNCTSCHAADASWSAFIQTKQAPVLDAVGTRVRPAYLKKFLADPQQIKPGTTMPNVLAGLTPAERERRVEALVHFLATTGSITETAPLRQAAHRGEKLFHSVGCVACHDPRSEKTTSPLATSIPLGIPSQKYTLPGLMQFLENPLAVRPSGRMPHLNLSANDARDVASFLLNDLDLASGLQYAYYEGSWNKLPDFSTLQPKEVGEAESFDISLAKKRDHFALRFEGMIKVEQDGVHMFVLGSDDGSRLTIDGKVIVDNDGIHPPQQKRAKPKLTAGLHTIVVEYFEQGGGEELQVLVEGPGLALQGVERLVAVKQPKAVKMPEEQFKVDPSLAAQGRELFASLGCASCHSLKENNAVVATTAVAPPLASLRAESGCLSVDSTKTPFYALDAGQRQSLAAAIGAVKQPAQPLSDNEFVSRSLVRFNCVACHQRGELGGIEEARNPHFQSDMPEMGDEGRIPPHLNGVGAKLQTEWLKTVFEQGAKDRPYMFTRMPRFGLANLGHLVTALAKADAHAIQPAPTVDIPDDDKRFKAVGRRLVGSQGYGCIKCHTFAGKKATGIQSISMTTMHQRLRPDWFHAYLLNPQAYRPGTRMPAAWPNGETTLPDVLDGEPAKQIRSVWAYLKDGDQGILPLGLVTGAIEVVAFDEAVMYRNFIQGAGTRAIGVGYPEKLNLAFDANEMRLAMIWHGGFIDAARHWTGRGPGFEPPLGDRVLSFVESPPFAMLDGATAAPWPTQPAKEQGYKFRGYRLGEKRKPTFLYSYNDLQIEDYITPYGEADAYVLRRTLTLKSDKPVGNVWYRAAVAEQIESKGDGLYVVDDQLQLRIGSATLPQLRDSGGKREMLVPVKFENGKAQIVQDYEW